MCFSYFFDFIYIEKESKKSLWFFLVFVVLYAVGAVSIWAYVSLFVPLGFIKREITFEIPIGASTKSTCLILENKGLVRNGNLLAWYLRYKKYDKPVKAGEYRFSPTKNAYDLFYDLTKGKGIVIHKLIIPEGFTVKQIADMVEKNLSVSAKKFMELCRSREIVSSMRVTGAESLEGYLFPDTYYFTKYVDAKVVIHTMLHRFFSLVSAEDIKRARELGFSLHQLITLASIVEKETSNDAERFLVSSVYHERLKKNMRLECDPTVIYGIENFNGNITRKDLRTPSPYNTYLNFGLPPGPIANPGLKSIKAALYPAAANYLYFVSKNDGTHYFSTDLKEHNLAVDKYQRSFFHKQSKEN